MLVYNGKLDFICNYFGGSAWTNATKWSGQVSEIYRVNHLCAAIRTINAKLYIISTSTYTYVDGLQ